MGARTNTEVVVLTALKNNGSAMMRMERLKKTDINYKQVHHIAGGPYKGILVNKQADHLNTVGPCEGRVEFIAYLINSDQNNAAVRDRWTLRFWFRGQVDGVTKKQTLTDYFAELISPKTLPRKYVGFVKRALVLLQRYTLIKRLELEVQELDGDEEDLPPISRGQVDGVTKKQTLTDYFAELISPKTLPRKYVGFVKRALVLLQRYTLIKRLELEVQELDGDEEDLPPIKSFVSVFTPDSYTYRFVPEVPVDSKTFLAFKIKAACDAHLSLCAVYGDVERKTYEICLGAENNSRSFIRDGSFGPIKSEAHTVKLLDEHDFRYFWISWADHHVQVGRGAKQGQGTFLSWVVPPNRHFKVNSMAVATSRQAKGQWEFAEIM
ncbi:C3 and pzp-like alpha-2-macroglobulin domain-containing protein 8, partial [Plakobranchus ocellatus]